MRCFFHRCDKFHLTSRLKNYILRSQKCSGVAQPVEQMAVNHRVGGSSPSTGV